MRARILLGGAAAGITAVLLAGCSASSGNSTSADVQVNPDATLKVGVTNLQSSWDIAKTAGSLEVPIQKMVYDGLTGLDEKNNVVPGLAESWSTPDGGKSYDFTLRTGVTFSNGDAFDASSAKATIDHYLTAPGSTVAGQLANLQEVEIVSPSKLRFLQKQADVSLPAVLSDRAGIMMDAKVIAAGDFTKPVGTGPFTLQSAQAGVSITLTKQPKYWSPDTVRVAGVTISQIQDPVAMANAIRSGSVDMGVVGAAQASDLQAAGDTLGTYPIKGRQLSGITWNPDLYKPLADQRVRDALNMAIDRQGIVKGVFLGQGEAASQFRAEGASGFSSTAKPIPYDPEQAKKLLAEAGYANGLSFSMVAPVKFAKEAEAVQANWAAIGVNVKVTTPPGSGPADALWYKPSVAVGFWSFDGRNDLSNAYQQMLLPSAAYNPGKVADPKVTDLIKQSAATADPAARAKVFDQLAEITSASTQANTPVAWVYQVVAYSKSLVGVKPSESGYPILTGVGVAANK
ncbi:ABC transporter substrate-binding protein [Arthrobacter sp. MA-N2]|uniref:ABC transporter substrate-binding protein n=1 Tax=Arthrobacter sp. MA-N2 TaxID=1101188 RepID=UPI0009DCB0F0|nr:ABC transporter substrate-binding protein [Arthrobacter sp. MA-N2]